MSYDQQSGQNPAPDVHSKPGAGAWFAPHAASPGGSDWDDDSKSPQATSNIPNQQAHLQPHKAVYGPGTGNGPAGAQHHQKTEEELKKEQARLALMQQLDGPDTPQSQQQ